MYSCVAKQAHSKVIREDIRSGNLSFSILCIPLFSLVGQFTENIVSLVECRRVTQLSPLLILMQ